MFSGNRARAMAAAIAAIVIGGGSYGIVAATSSGATVTSTSSATSGYPFAGGSGARGSNARNIPWRAGAAARHHGSASPDTEDKDVSQGGHADLRGSERGTRSNRGKG
jgi:hypothetical protein